LPRRHVENVVRAAGSCIGKSRLVAARKLGFDLALSHIGFIPHELRMTFRSWPYSSSKTSSRFSSAAGFHVLAVDLDDQELEQLLLHVQRREPV
jgi:hypothetical protein